MHINKVTDSSSTDLFFEIMSKFNNDIEKIKREELDSATDFIKEASVSATGWKYFSRIGEISTEALKVGKKAMPALAEVLEKAAKPVNFSAIRVHGVKNLLIPNAKGSVTASFKKVSANLGDALDKMARDKANITRWMKPSGEITDEGLDFLRQAARREGFVSDEAADEFIKAINNGDAFMPAYKNAGGGPVNQRLFKATQKGGGDAASAGTKGTQAAGDTASAGKAGKAGETAGDAASAGKASETAGDAASAGKASETAGDAASAGKADVGVDAKITKEVGEEASRLGMRGKIDEIGEIMRDVRKAVGGDDAIIQNAFTQIEKALVVAKTLKPKALRLKMEHTLRSLKRSVSEMQNGPKGVRNSIDQSFGDIGEGASVIQNFNQAGGSVLTAMEKSTSDAIKTIGGMKRLVKDLNDVGTAIPRAASESASGAAAGAKVTVNLGDDMIDSLSPALQAEFRANREGFDALSRVVVKNSEEMASYFKGLRDIIKKGGDDAAEALRVQKEWVETFKRMEKQLHRVSGDLFGEMKRLGVNLGPEYGIRWAKYAKLIMWGLAATGAAVGSYFAYKKWGPEGWIGVDPKTDGGPGGGGGGGAGGGEASGTRETGREDYPTVTDPSAKASLALADPNSAKYNSRTGWQASNRTIEKLISEGRTAELKAYVEAKRALYRKSFSMRLNPPFVVHGSPQRLYYAFLNQHRSPAPNLSEPSGTTLVLKNRLLNNALHNPTGRGVPEIFDVKKVLSRGDAQLAINETAEVTVAKGLAETGNRPWWHMGSDWGTPYYRAERWLEGKELDSDVDQAIAGRRRKRYSEGDLRMIEEIRRNRTAEDRFDSLKKLAELSTKENSERLINLESLASIANKSTNITKNTDNQTLEKKADDFSKSYYKDAIADLNDTDKTLRSYFAGLGGLYDQRLEKRKADFKTLYNVTDETGEDLIYSAHPKEVIISDSIGRGGLVENGLEQKRQTHGVALSAPTGNYRANYASRYDALKKLAN